MGIIDMVKKGFATLHKNTQFLITLFTVNVVLNIISFPFTPGVTPGEQPAAPGLGIALMGIVFLLAGVFIQGATLGSTNEIIKKGLFQGTKC